jgi:hypothetical protein
LVRNPAVHGIDDDAVVADDGRVRNPTPVLAPEDLLDVLGEPGWLPDAVEVGFSIGRARRLEGRDLVLGAPVELGELANRGTRTFDVRRTTALALCLSFRCRDQR